MERPRKNRGNSVFKSALDGALPVNAICIALIFVFGSLLKTDERRSSVTLWGRSAQSQTPNKLHLPGNSRWCGTPFASVPIGTVCPDGQPKRPSSLIRCHGSFWAEGGLSAFGLTGTQSGLSGCDPIADMLLCTFSDGSVLATSSISGVIFSPPCFGFDRI